MRIPYRRPGKFSQIKPDPLMTKEKLLELQNKLARLKKAQPTAMAEVSRLAELGDFSENAEYQLAKGRLRGINNNILRLEQQINQAQIIKPKTDGTIDVGNTVTLEINGIKKIYLILGSSQTDPAQGIISHLSPIGRALLGHQIGDALEITINNRKNTYKILEIK